MSSAAAMLVACLFAGALSIGTLLTIIGLRGRRIDDHPICRKCGFDLFGSSGSARCPECGNELLPGRVRIGHRVRRRRPLALGLLLVIPLLLLFIAGSVAVYRGANWEQEKPFWLLLREGDWPAVAELNRREFVARSLTPSEEQQLVAAGLAVQGDPKKSWSPDEWGALIERMRSAGKVNEQDWQRYARQATAYWIKIRPIIRRGEPMPISFMHGQGRVNSRLFHVKLRLSKRRIDDIDVGRGLPDGFKWSEEDFDDFPNFLPGAVNTLCFPLLTDPAHPIALGHHVFHCDLIVEVREGQATYQPETTPPLATITKAVSLPITITDKPTVELVHNPSLLPKIMASLSVKSPNYGVPANTIALDRNEMRTFVHFTNSPIGLDFDVFLRDAGGREWKLYSSLELPPHAPPVTGGWNVSGPVKGFAGDKADLILRPNLAAAAHTTYLTRIWGDEIVIHDLKVIWAPGTPRPWSSP